MMSKIWICRGKKAETPFRAEEQKIDLYSLEELCYYLYKNAEAVEESFFGEGLFGWLERELELPELSARLREGSAEGKNGLWCLEVLLWESGFYTRRELEERMEDLNRLLQAEPEERGKLKADRELSEGKYKSAVRAYQQLLQQSLDRELESRIWHNLGTAYAGQFLFARAAECYEKAYTMGRREDSRQQYLLARACAEGELPDRKTEVPADRYWQQLKEEKGMLCYEEEMYQRLEQLAVEYVRSE